MSPEFRKHRDALASVRRNAGGNPRTADMIARAAGYENLASLEKAADQEAVRERQVGGVAIVDREVRELTEEARRLTEIAEEKSRRVQELFVGRDSLTRSIAEMEALEVALKANLDASPASVASWKRELVEFWSNPRFVLQDSDGITLRNHANLIDALQAEPVLVEAWTAALAANADKLVTARKKLKAIVTELESTAPGEPTDEEGSANVDDLERQPDIGERPAHFSLA